MVRGRPRKEGATRPERRKVNKYLEPQPEAKVPPLPPAQDWIQADTWPLPVRQWWNDIHRSPMSSEYVEADLPGLYAAASYLAQGLDPKNKLAERLKLLQAWESTIKAYGGSPVARENLKWQISQGEQAEQRTKKIRERAKPEPKPEAKKPEGPQAKIIELYAQHS